MAKQKPKTELTAINQLPPELLKITETSGIAITEAKNIGFKFAPFMQKVNEISMQIEAIERDNPTPEDAVLARKLRLSLVENRGIKGLATVHKDLKAESLVRGRLIDSFRNVVDQSSEMSELIAERIEKHSERVEAQRQLELSDTRKFLLEPFGTDTTYLPLGKISDEQFEKILANEKLLFEAKKAEQERIEAQRLENERIAEENRQEMLRLQAERIEAERLEAIRVKEELAAKEALLQKERETARIAAEKIAKENARKLAEQQKLAEIERKKQAEILAKQQETARIEREKQQAANDRLQAELQAKKDAEAKIINDRLAAEKEALAASDREKGRGLYDNIMKIFIIAHQSEPGKQIALLTAKRIKESLAEIAVKSKELI